MVNDTSARAHDTAFSLIDEVNHWCHTLKNDGIVVSPSNLLPCRARDYLRPLRSLFLDNNTHLKSTISHAYGRILGAQSWPSRSRSSVEAHIYGNPENLHPYFQNNLTNLCKTVIVPQAHETLATIRHDGWEALQYGAWTCTMTRGALQKNVPEMRRYYGQPWWFSLHDTLEHIDMVVMIVAL